ncbi:hypothetical protein SAMN03080594_10586 [Arenibacter palladensis]|uniref:Uncharacterized protein n=1 Tax=Arenibacter palladensis TaxID=237373 RepID=A0A1M5CK37_9FLAO|nr:hypothetical protein [Arenibacter palladensis]SHF55069.1 hypothetical protein SAMN03080594_10586 [Arenibacter palladensis]
MKLFVGLILVLLTLNCSDDDSDDASNCSDVFCTEEFRTITVSVKDKDGVAVALDNFKVVVLSNEEDITLDASNSEYEWMAKNGSYPLFSDKYVTKYRNKEIEINFQGYVDDKLLVDSDYTVGADCCHVTLVEGETDIVIANP